MSWANRGSTHVGSMMFHASIAYGGDRYWGHQQREREPPGQRVDAPQFKYTERFPPEVEAKAMELLRKFMSPEQYEAFVDRADIELENKAGTHRIIINQNGSFTVMKGDRGAGIVLTSGNVRSYRFPLGDEIAAFLDWFRYRTDDLIANWNCGNFGIVRDRLEQRYIDEHPIGEGPEEVVRGVGFLGAAMAQLGKATRDVAEAIERIFDKGR